MVLFLSNKANINKLFKYIFTPKTVSLIVMKKPTNKPMHTLTKKKVAQVTKFLLIIGFFRIGTLYHQQ